MTNKFLPSIWLGAFDSKRNFDSASPQRQSIFSVYDGIDDRLLTSRHAITINAYCAVCEAVTPMKITWHYGAANPEGSINPAWTETAVCERCGLNSRMRALIDFLHQLADGGRQVDKVYLAERTTPSYRIIKSLFKEVIGSEYLGPDKAKGSTSISIKGHEMVQHEDLTCLSFSDQSFDLIVTQDVFEHIPNYKRAFAECARVLRNDGILVFTIPFFFDQEKTRIRASLCPDGSVEHHFPPEIHGNPVSAQGSLCFQNFGWDILPDLRANGFKDAKASLYWGPWQGHLGVPFFVFSATKAI